MPISTEAKEIAEKVYRSYGSSTGYLFGVPPELRHAVEAIIQCALDYYVEDLEAKKETVNDD